MRGGILWEEAKKVKVVTKMIHKLRRKFTEWYEKHNYDWHGGEFICPWWVKPFTILFSPSVFFSLRTDKQIAAAKWGYWKDRRY